MKQTLSIARKELNSYFSSPMALIFVGVFLAATLFTFFWADEFFTRGLADVRSLFRWMPILMIFLVAALTMRQWSEEEQSGTMELLFTMPMKLYQLVIGKFLAVLGLVIVALLLTTFLPISVSFMGDPDIGPIIGGYLAAILMSSAYIAIGLFVSSRTSNQIVALILTVLICGLFQLVGSRQLTDLVDASTAEVMRAFGTGSRFESIERGVLDLRDLVYYLSITGIFLALNIVSLDSKRWGKGQSTAAYRFNTSTTVMLIAVNLIAINGVLYPLRTARLDLTEDREYSLSDVTRDTLRDLDEPLLVRAYISEKNHPLLAPLIPRVRDTLEEYKVASNGNMELEILDPITDPEKETEANETYGIRPSPLQTSDRSGASVLNVYFDILIRYGDQNVTLNFGDLIEVEQVGDSDVRVTLRNLEYDLTRSIKRVVSGFQSVDVVLASFENPARLILYYTPETLPEDLQEAPATIQQVAERIESISNGKFEYSPVNMDDPNNRVDVNQLYSQYGIQPVAESFFAEDTFYLHMVLLADGKAQVIYPAGEVSETEVRADIEAALQRASSGFLKTVGIWTPPAGGTPDMFGQVQPSLQQFGNVTEVLRQNYEVQTVDLTQGQPPSVDVLLVIAPQNMTDLERFAIDQYLMRGGTVFVAAGNYQISQDQFSGSIALAPLQNGLRDMLAFYGVNVENTMVVDSQNLPFPYQTARGTQLVDYATAVDVRQDGLERDNAMFASLPGIALFWTSPVRASDTDQLDVTTLIRSSEESWVTTSTNFDPDFSTAIGFPIQGEPQRHPLAVLVEGTFTSFFKDKPSPFAAGIDVTTTPDQQPPVQPVSMVDSSPDTARLVVVGSSEFLNDNILGVLSQLTQGIDANAMLFMQNVVDWSTEDTDLLSIRARGTSTRLLDPLEDDEQNQWEGLNYGLAIVSLIALGALWQWRKRSERPMEIVGVPGYEEEDEQEEETL